MYPPRIMYSVVLIARVEETRIAPFTLILFFSSQKRMKNLE